MRTPLWCAVLVVNVVAVGVFLSAPRDSAWQVGAFFVPLLLAVGLLADRAKRTPPGARGPLPVLLAAQFGYLVTSVFWYPVPVFSGEALPFPSFVDAMYFTVYAAYAVFLLRVLRRRARDGAAESRIALTDSLILTASMSALLWEAVVEPDISYGATSAATVVAVGYPVFTLLIFVLAVRLAVGSDLRRSVPGVLLLVWVAAEIIGDTVYAVQNVNGSFHYGSVLSVAWMVSNAAVAAVAVHPGTGQLLAGSDQSAKEGLAPSSGRVWSRTVTRAAHLVVLLASALLTVVMSYTDNEHSPFLLGASVVAVSLVVYRTSLLAGDLDRERRLAAELDDAVRQLREQHDRLERQSVEMERLAFHDSVTGLGNRALLRQRAEAVSGSLADTTLLLLDLDGFKEVNDTLGHAAGDVLLLEVGDRLGRCVRASDTVARLGGDEFALLLPGTGPVAAAQTAERVLVELREPFFSDQVAVRIRGSIGVAPGATAIDLDEMLRNADLAMYEAKGAGRDQACTFDPDMYAHATSRLGLDTEVRAAIAHGDFTVYYQPIVDAVSCEVRSLEALARWDHPARGVLPPSEFLPAAERTGQIVELGRYVLRTACTQLAAWRQDWPHLVVAVNVSHQELLAAGFADHVAQVLSETGLPAGALHLEVTETVMAAEENVARIVEPLVALGVLFSIDDFGTGHSSLSRLRGLQVNRLKIDRSFIAEIGDGDHPSAPLLASIILLAHSIGQLVVAEGVETAAQAAFLTAHGCDELQGYLFSRPVAPGQVISVLLATGTPATDGGYYTPESAFPQIIAALLDQSQPLDTLLPQLLEELAVLSGLECAYITELDPDHSEQTTRHSAQAHRGDEAPVSHRLDRALADVTRNDGGSPVRVPPGLLLRWSQTLCRRMLEDNLRCTNQVPERYGDVVFAKALGIQTFITIPIRNDDGRLRGTLCAASSETREVDVNIVKLMELFAQAVAGRFTSDSISSAAAESIAP